MKWLSTRSAYLVIVPTFFAASIAMAWLPEGARLRVATVLLGLVITRYVAMWLHQYAGLFTGSRENSSKAEMTERQLSYLFESHMDDINAMGSSHKPIHVKTDDFGALGSSHNPIYIRLDESDLRPIRPDG